MLNIKKLLTKMLTNIKTLSDNFALTSLTLTYTSNSIVSATDFARLAACRRSKMLYMYGNLGIAFAGNTGGFVEIGRISGWVAAYDVLITVPQQSDGAKVALVNITPGGVIKVYTETGAANGWFRFSVCIPQA